MEFKKTESHGVNYAFCNHEVYFDSENGFHIGINDLADMSAKIKKMQDNHKECVNLLDGEGFIESSLKLDENNPGVQDDVIELETIINGGHVKKRINIYDLVEIVADSVEHK